MSPASVAPTLERRSKVAKLTHKGMAIFRMTPRGMRSRTRQSSGPGKSRAHELWRVRLRTKSTATTRPGRRLPTHTPTLGNLRFNPPTRRLATTRPGRRLPTRTPTHGNLRFLTHPTDLAGEPER